MEADLAVSVALTGIIVTSPVSSHPCTELLDRVVFSLSRCARGFCACPLVVVCDGYAIGPHDADRRNFGTITQEQAASYEQFKSRLRKEERSGTTILELSEWRGFALALEAALELVRTPLVLVCPHDYEFLHEVDLPRICGLILQCDGMQASLPQISELLRGAEATADGRYVTAGAELKSHCSDAEEDGRPLLISYVGFCAAKQVKDYYKRGAGKDNSRVGMAACEVSGLLLWPLLAWKENPHIASVAAYRRLVFGHDRFRRGEFIEDRLGNVMRDDIKSRGIAHHQRNYGMYLCLPGGATGDDDGAAGPQECKPTLYHMDGRCYRPVGERIKLGWKVAQWEVERASAASAL